MVGRRLVLSPKSFPDRLRDSTTSLADGALAGSEEAEEIEDEREVRDESETIESGEEAVEIVLASEERRVTEG
jgi:hypothetical protein